MKYQKVRKVKLQTRTCKTCGGFYHRSTRECPDCPRTYGRLWFIGIILLMGGMVFIRDILGFLSDK